MTQRAELPTDPPPEEPADAWWDVPRFSADDVRKLLVEYVEQKPEFARKVVLDLWRRVSAR